MSLEISSFDSKWLERGWWTAAEAFCVFVGYPPDTRNNGYVFQALTIKFDHIYDLVVSAEIDGLIQDMTRLPSCDILKAPCKSWIAWGRTKTSIAQNLSSELIEAVGLKEIRKERTNESYRPDNEKVIKAAFLATARIALHLCLKARLDDIESLFNRTNISHVLPSSKTLRNWLKEADIRLSSTTPSKATIQETLTTLKILLPAPEAKNASLPLEKS